METYLDYAATTPVRREVVDVVTTVLQENWGNASSPHATGRRARGVVEVAREQVARLVGCAPETLCFTSGGTEANNLAVLGVARAAGRGHVVCSGIEHHSVLDACRALEREGFAVSWVQPNAAGVVAPEALAAALRSDTVLACLMLVNNEVGSRQPVREVADLCHERGVVLHVDAVAAAGRMGIDVDALGADLLSVSAHKIYGPRGVGALFVRSGLELLPLFHGGGQERRWRPGTENVAAVAGFGLAADLARQEWAAWSDHLEMLQRAFLAAVADLDVGARAVGPTDPQQRVPGILSFTFPDWDGDALRTALDLRGVRVGAGAACSSGSTEPSHVLMAMGCSAKEAQTVVRLSFGSGTEQGDVVRLADALREAVALQREAMGC